MRYLGVTGVRERVSEEAIDLLHRVRRQTRIPLALGFGISSPAHVQTCASAGAEGVIVGSALVGIVERNINDSDIMERELKEFVLAMKGVR